MYLFNGDLGGLPLKRSDFVRGHDDRRFVRTTLNRSRIRKALNIRVIRRCSFVLRTRLYSDRAKLEDDGRDGFEVMDPFFTFGALAAEVEPSAEQEENLLDIRLAIGEGRRCTHCIDI